MSRDKALGRGEHERRGLVMVLMVTIFCMDTDNETFWATKLFYRVNKTYGLTNFLVDTFEHVFQEIK